MISYWRVNGSWALPRVLRMVRARLSSESPRRNWSRIDVVGQVRDAVFGQAGDPEEVGDLLGHDDADVGAGAALQQRVDVFAETEFVSARGSQVAEAVDGDPGGAGALHGVQQVVDPFVEIQIDRGCGT